MLIPAIKIGPNLCLEAMFSEAPLPGLDSMNYYQPDHFLYEEMRERAKAGLRREAQENENNANTSH